MQKITPFLWFDAQAEEAAAIAELGMRIEEVTGDAGTVMTDRLRAEGPAVRGLEWRAGFSLYQCGLAGGELRLTGGRLAWAPNFTAGVAEILSATREAEGRDWKSEKSITSGRSCGWGGEQVECGWLKDKFRMPWQIVPGQLWDWFKNPAKVKRVTSEVWQMKKLDLATLERAADGDSHESYWLNSRAGRAQEKRNPVLMDSNA